MFHVISDFFDIMPKACWASTINLIEDRCPVDESLFSGFTRLSAGNITNTFYMLRPTTTMAGMYDVMFTCLLEVCMYNCQQVCVNVCSFSYSNGCTAIVFKVWSGGPDSLTSLTHF